MITVMGATGHTGSAIARRLLDAGEKVRALGRSAAKLDGLRSLGAEAVVGDMTDPAFLTEACSGADADDVAEEHVRFVRAFSDGSLTDHVTRTPENTTPTRFEDVATGCALAYDGA